MAESSGPGEAPAPGNGHATAPSAAPGEAPDGVPAVPEARLAASVVLLRDGADGPEVFVQHRVSTMDFAAGMVVFPGGRVDAVDGSGWAFADDIARQHTQAWRRCSIGADDAGTARHNAGRVLAAALREVEEEAGLVLDAGLLRPWANWVTPEDQPKRFDTYFYLAAPAPEDEARHQTTEAWQSLWMPVRAILEGEAAGALKLMPPTLVLLEELLRLGSTGAALAVVRDIVPVRPEPGALKAFFERRRQKPPSTAP
ncbi:NUDIX hydrolase [Arthrobacter celericrescens]|uniref:NUDIX hydrolase n=1 Tax=Arthrobacter celericrescens TaxID=2320851 RepID=UPI000EA34EC8|nr:NUDIX hydrolase [Arthrobacter celericrescens]